MAQLWAFWWPLTLTWWAIDILRPAVLLCLNHLPFVFDESGIPNTLFALKLDELFLILRWVFGFNGLQLDTCGDTILGLTDSTILNEWRLVGIQELSICDWAPRFVTWTINTVWVWWSWIILWYSSWLKCILSFQSVDFYHFYVTLNFHSLLSCREKSFCSHSNSCSQALSCCLIFVSWASNLWSFLRSWCSAAVLISSLW
jgi:hypothetical protein